MRLYEAMQQEYQAEEASRNADRPWRVWVGHLDVDVVEETAANWAAARIRLAEQIAPFLTDDCMDCRLDGTAAFNRLAALGYGQPFVATIDGDDYLMEVGP